MLVREIEIEMEAASAKEIRLELKERDPKELLDICLRLSRFKKENKELLTYLLFESADEASYIDSVKEEILKELESVDKQRYYAVKRALRKVLRNLRKYIRYSGNKETEVELLLFYCEQFQDFQEAVNYYSVLDKLFVRTKDSIDKKILKLHEDLQFDYQLRIREL